MKKYLFIAFLVVFCFSCEKEAALTPDETTSPLMQGGVGGRGNTNARFFAKVNGENFNAQSIRGIESGNSFIIEAFKDDGKMVLSTFGKATGTYLSSSNVFNEISYFPDSLPGDEFRTFFLGSNSDGRIKITNYDQTNNTISGTFSGYVVDGLITPSDSLNITQGEFSNIKVLPNPTGEMQATVGGNAFVADRCSFNNSNVSGQFVEAVTAQATDSSYTITIAFPNNISVGTYDLDSSPVFCLLVDKAGNTYNSNLGEVTISRADRLLDEINGEFNFIAIDSTTLDILNVTSGSFFAIK